MIDLAPPSGDPIGTPPDRNPSSPRSEVASSRSGGEYAVLFERFFDSFRRQVLECYGKRCDVVIDRAVEKVAARSPGFSLHAISADNALSVLDFAETMINEASLFKRRRLRQSALAGLSELYNTHYETLERNGAADKVEQFYYRLKK